MRSVSTPSLGVSWTARVVGDAAPAPALQRGKQALEEHTGGRAVARFRAFKHFDRRVVEVFVVLGIARHLMLTGHAV